MANVLKGAKKGSVLCGGQFVTVLGTHFGFRGAGFETCTELHPGMRLLNELWFRQSKLITSYNLPDGSSFVTWAEIKNSRAAGEGTSRVQEEEEEDVQAQAPLGPSDPMSSLIDRMDRMNTNFDRMYDTMVDWRAENREDFNRLDGRVTTIQNEMDRRNSYVDSLAHSFFEHQQFNYHGYDGTYYSFDGSADPRQPSMPMDQDPQDVPPQPGSTSGYDWTGSYQGASTGDWDKWLG